MKESEEGMMIKSAEEVARPVRVGERFRRALVARNFARSTVETYVGCMAGLCRWAPVPPMRLEGEHVAGYLSAMAHARRTAHTQKQILCAAARFFELVLKRPMGDLDFRAGSQWRKMPVVLSREEVLAIFEELDGVRRLRVELLYGCGLRKSELLRLRVKDLDFGRGRLVVHNGKGGKDRELALPQSLLEPLRGQVARVERLHSRELRAGRGWVALPGALERKWPGAPYRLEWQWLFPARGLSRDPHTGTIAHAHYCGKTLTREVAAAVRAAEVRKKVGCHTFRHSFATHQVEDGVDIRTLQALMGHKSIETTQIYLHTAKGRIDTAGSPLDRLHASRKVVAFSAA